MTKLIKFSLLYILFGQIEYLKYKTIMKCYIWKRSFEILRGVQERGEIFKIGKLAQKGFFSKPGHPFKFENALVLPGDTQPSTSELINTQSDETLKFGKKNRGDLV